MFVGANEDRASQLRVLSAITRKYALLEEDCEGLGPWDAWGMHATCRMSWSALAFEGGGDANSVSSRIPQQIQARAICEPGKRARLLPSPADGRGPLLSLL